VQLGPFTIVRRRAARLTTLGDIHHATVGVETKAAQQLLPLSGRGGWWSVLRESFLGAWQRNVDVNMDTVLTYFAVFACVTLIASDVAKLSLRLVEQDSNGIWTETESPAFSPVLRKPNRFQTIIKFVEQWIVSKLIHGNTYVLKQRDNRGVVVALYVLDPTRVTPLVAPDGGVYYELRRDDLSGLQKETVTVPAKDIIHDTMVALYHPLIGVSPIYACGVAAMQGLTIQGRSNTFFANGSRPGGVLTAPGNIEQATADRLKAYWDENFGGDNAGKVAVLGDGLTYEGMTQNAVDSQLIEQLKWTAENVCSTFHVPPYMIGVGPPPPYANIEPLLQQYYSQCIQSLLTNFETCLDEGIGIAQKIDGRQFGTEFDIDDLIWMDTATKTKAALDSIGSAAMSPDEARKKYFGLGPIKGGQSAYMQQQNYSLEALAERDRNNPFAPKPTPGPPVPLVQRDLRADLKAAVRANQQERLRRVA
jgi:HK97 family phage portal protein